jgi:hypothetical protein
MVFDTSRITVITSVVRYSTEWLGKRIVYHATNHAAALAIDSEKEMKPGKQGLFGGAIYFAATPEIAIRKAMYDGRGVAVMIVAEVDLGRGLVLNCPQSDLTLATVRAQGADSVKGRSSLAHEWEYAVYEANRVEVRASYETSGK